MNRRKFTRQPIQLSALVHPEQGRSWLCSIRDFCEEGMMLAGGAGSRSLSSTGADISAGDKVALHFSVATPEGQQHFRTQATVARVLDGGNGLGVSFDTGLEQRTFDRLVDFAVASGTMVPAEFAQDVDDLPDVAEVDDSGQVRSLQPAEPTLARAGRATAAAAGSASATPGQTPDEAQETAQPATAQPSAARGQVLPADEGDPALRDRRLSKDVAQKLLLRIQAVAKRGISSLAAGFLAKANEDFLISARDAGTNAVQARYFEALETFEKYNEMFVGRLVGGVLQQIDKVSDLDAVLERRRKRESGNTSKLELVDTEEFEHWLQVAENISKSENRYKDSLLDMRAQFGMIAKPWSHKDVVPVGPSAIWWTFDDAMGELSLHDDVRKRAFELFAQQFDKVMPSLYEALDKLFEDSGQLPSLEELRESLQPKYRIRNRAGVTVTPADYQDMDQNLREATMAADNVGAGRIEENPFVPAVGAAVPAYDTARSILSVFPVAPRRSSASPGRTVWPLQMRDPKRPFTRQTSSRRCAQFRLSPVINP